MGLEFKRRMTKLAGWLRPDAPGPLPLPVGVAQALTERNRFTDLLNYRDIDPETNIVILDDGEAPALGFILGFSPLMVAGIDSETQFEAVFNACPSGTIVQFGKLSTPQVD